MNTTSKVLGEYKQAANTFRHLCIASPTASIFLYAFFLVTALSIISLVYFPKTEPFVPFIIMFFLPIWAMAALIFHYYTFKKLGYKFSLSYFYPKNQNPLRIKNLKKFRKWLKKEGFYNSKSLTELIEFYSFSANFKQTNIVDFSAIIAMTVLPVLTVFVSQILNTEVSTDEYFKTALFLLGLCFVIAMFVYGARTYYLAPISKNSHTCKNLVTFLTNEKLKLLKK